MHICMLAGNPLTYDGRVLRHASALTQAGHQVTLLGVIGPNDEAAPLPDLQTLGHGRLQALRIDRRRHGVGLGTQARWLWTAGRRHLARQLVLKLGALPLCSELMVAPVALELLWAAVQTGARVFHANDLDTLVPAAWAARLTGGSYIYDAHELYTDESPGLAPQERAARKYVEARLIRGARAVITVNDLLAAELVRLYDVPRPTVLRNVPRLIPLLPPSSLAPSIEAPPPLRVLLHGSFVGLEQPGVEAALQAVAQVPQVQLTLRGGLRDPARLQEKLRSLGLTERVQLRSRLPGAEALVAAAIAERHDVGLSVHLPDCSSRRLATSSKVFEYLMAGLAVVAADQEGNRHILDEQCARFFQPGDVADLKRVLQTLASAPAEVRSLQLAARRRAETDSCWERESQRLLNLYLE